MTSNRLKGAMALGFAVILLSRAALAQTDAAPATTGKNAADGDFDAIIVTARRVEERLQDVPISITVFNQQQLLDRNVTDGIDLAHYTPSLSVNTNFGSENTIFAIRGFTQELQTTPSVGFYFADVVAPRGVGSQPAGDGGGPGDFFDLQNVQILKGPQGTLFGRNTTGGAILIVPQMPTSKLEGYGEISYGSYDMKRAQGALNLPMGDRVRLRLAVDRQTRDGYVTNTSGVGPARFDDIDYLAMRASLVVDVTSDIENYTIASSSRSSTVGDLDKLAYCNPAQTASNFLGPLACAQIAAFGPRGGFYSAQNDMPDPISTLTQWQVINTTTWNAIDTLTVKNIVSYAQLQDVKRSDIFGNDYYLAPTIPLPQYDVRNGPGSAIAHQSTLTEELQLQGRTPDRRLTYQVGGYLEISEPIGSIASQSPQLVTCSNPNTFQCTDYLGLAAGSPVGSIAYVNSQTTYRDVGVYAQSTYAITDQWKVTGGIRYTKDESMASVEDISYYFPAPNFPLGLCTNFLVRQPGLPIESPSDCLQRLEKNSSAPTWLLDVDYKPIEDLLLYGKYARGYREGSINAIGAEGFQTFDPEKVDAYEVGSKLSFAEAVHGTLNLAAFYNKLSHQQLQIVFYGPNVAPTPSIVNAGKSRIYGLEAESSISPFQGFRLDTSYAYLNTELQSITVPALSPLSVYNTYELSSNVGDHLPLTPTHKLSVTGTYQLPLPEELGRLSAGSTFVYTSAELVNDNSPYAVIQPTRLVNLNVDWHDFFKKPVDVSFFVTNLTNRNYYSYVVGAYNGSGSDGGQLSAPRMFGVRLRYRFGE